MMQDYLNQLIIRNQSSELGVEPRSLSRFESSQDSISKSFDSSEIPLDAFASIAVEELGESESPTRQSALAEVEEKNPIQQIKRDELDSSREAAAPLPYFSVQTKRKVEPRSLQRPVDFSVERPTHPAPRPEKYVKQQFLTEKAFPTEKVELSRSAETAVQQEKVRIQPSVAFAAPDSIQHSQEKTSAPDSISITQFREKERVRAETPTMRPLFEWKPTVSAESDIVSNSRREIIQPFIESVASQNAAKSVTDTQAPTIQITIGRIEVRATAAAAPAKRADVKSPAMSLDDYLKQRQRGGRT